MAVEKIMKHEVECLPRLLRAIASGTDAQKNGHDFILEASAEEIERLREALERADHTLTLRAAIKAMRQPNGKMIDAGAESFDFDPFNTPGMVGQPTKCWQAMIDAALEPKE